MKGSPRTDYLSPREVEVLRLVGRCFRTKEIAAQLGISQKTVEKHREQCCAVLGAHSAGELVYRAFQLGLIQVTTQFMTQHNNGRKTRWIVPALEPVSR